MKNKIVKILTDGGIERNEALCEADLIIESVSGLSKEEILCATFLKNTEKMIEIATQRAHSRKPLQHLLGYVHFMGEKFMVTPDVLVPRAETEILVDEALKTINKHDVKTVLDIGTGSGCIACIVGLKSNCEVLGVDISLDALDVAINNVQNLGLIRKVLIRKSDLFSNIKESFDLIVSNPPYIPFTEKGNLQPEVLFDPEIALFADDNGLEFYKKIITEAPKHLNNGGFLIFETGASQGDEIVKFMKDYVNIRTVNDLSGIKRVVSARKKGW